MRHTHLKSLALSILLGSSCLFVTILLMFCIVLISSSFLMPSLSPFLSFIPIIPEGDPKSVPQ